MNPHGLFGPASKAQVTNHLNAFALLENLELREDEEQQHESYNMTPLHVAVVENNVTDPRPIGFGVISCPARVWGVCRLGREGNPMIKVDVFHKIASISYCI